MENGVAPKVAGPQEPAPDHRLDSWKQIAAYLRRHMTTVRRWERSEGLPVHRHLHSTLGSVYASSKELDAWLLKRRSLPVPKELRPVLAMPVERHDVPFIAGRSLRAATRTQSVPLLGRKAECKALAEAWWRSRERQQQLVFITGDSGVGKTRLLSHFTASLAPDANAFAGQCDRPPHLPFTPFAEMLHTILRSTPTKVLRECLSEMDGSTELAHLAPGFLKLTRPESASAATTPEGHRFRMFEAFTGLVRALARRAPVLLAIEDLQWADEGSLLMLRYLVRSTRDIALCIIVTCCETELEQAGPPRDFWRTCGGRPRQPGSNWAAWLTMRFAASSTGGRAGARRRI